MASGNHEAMWFFYYARKDKFNKGGEEGRGGGWRGEEIGRTSWKEED